MTKEELLKKHNDMLILWKAWMDEKKKHEILTFENEKGDIVRHYPDGREVVIEYAE
ncbi:hypothetical protein [Lonepinella sp. BR2357]|uniref:hypothetical protein n=1 Tax=Lonepinella sp. BR2357 TaxID=3434549 RepID=UPI003F6E25C0